MGGGEFVAGLRGCCAPVGRAGPGVPASVSGLGWGYGCCQRLEGAGGGARCLLAAEEPRYTGRAGPGRASWERRGNAGCALPAAVDIQPACLGLYCGRTVLSVNGSMETYGECGVSAARPGLCVGWGLAPVPPRPGWHRQRGSERSGSR